MIADDLMITGCWVSTALGCSNACVLKKIASGQTNYQPHRQFEDEEGRKPLVGYAEDEALLGGIEMRAARKLDRFSLLTLQAFRQTLGATSENATRDFGILIGNSTGGWSFVEPQMDSLYSGDFDALSPYVATAWFPAAPQGEVSIQYKISGYSKTISADALSVGFALEHAKYLIENEYLPGVFVGGAEAPLSPLVYNSCLRSEPLSASGKYLPFHEAADGYLLGEGAGFFSLEKRKQVEERKGTSLACVKGIGIAPTLVEAIEQCLENGSTAPQDVACIFLDAKGTTTYDQEEFEALETIFHDCFHLYLTTTKTLHGGLLAADFAVQVALAALSLQHNSIPRGLWSKDKHKEPPCGQLVLDDPIEMPLRNVLLYTRNLDGSSVCVLLTQP